MVIAARRDNAKRGGTPKPRSVKAPARERPPARSKKPPKVKARAKTKQTLGSVFARLWSEAAERIAIVRFIRNARAAKRDPFLFDYIWARIIFIAVFGVFFFAMGLFYVGYARYGLVDERLNALKTYSRVVADSLARNAVAPVTSVDGMIDPYNPKYVFNDVEAKNLLQRMVRTAGYRARVIDRQGNIIADSIKLDSKTDVQVEDLMLPDPSLFQKAGDRFFNWMAGQMRRHSVYPFTEETDGRKYEEVRAVFEPQKSLQNFALRRTENGNMVVSLAVPIVKDTFHFGALLLTTGNEDIEKALAAERNAVLMTLLTAMAMSAFFAFFYGLYIAMPLRRLARVAERVRHARPGADGGERVKLPDYSGRSDEIGMLGGALRDMTQALYQRIDAIQQFAADVSHEIKNPLTSMRSAVETLHLARDEKSKQRLLDILKEDVGRIDRLITDIADASRLDAELSREAFRPIVLPALLDNIINPMRDTGAPRNVHIQLSVQTGNLPENFLRVRGIETRLGQVFRNIIDNAISFSPENGMILVTAGIDPRRRPPMAVIIIEDEGPGIPEENLESIFRRFYTERPSEADFGKNSGLGLSICKQIAEAHGGSVHAENRTTAEGERLGARFVIKLPLTRR